MIFEKTCAALITLIAGAVIVGVSTGLISAKEAGISALMIAAISFLLLILIHLKMMIGKEEDVKKMDNLVRERETERLNIHSDIDWQE